MDLQSILINNPQFIILGVWELIWKGIAMWQEAKAGQRGWYVATLVINTVGILPIVYLLFFQKEPWINKITGASKKSSG